ncbi:hypothetical protein J132_01222 [Termitomyces sp. J132]|nr:hypothetical protein J132_01222 [Termitomyces sp. J132]
MSDLASQFEKTMMAHAFLERVDRLLAMACASLAKDPHLAVTAIFQMWLQWFKTAGSGVEWPELVTLEKECCQLYKQYKGEEWVHPFDVHFTQVDPSLEFLMDNLTVGMTVSAPAVASTSDTTKHLVGALAVVRGEGQSKGHGDNEAANHKDIQEAGPSTPKAAAGGVARGVTTAGPIMTQRAAGTPWGSSPVIAVTAQGKAAHTVDGERIEVKHSSLILPTLQEEAVVGGSGGAKVKSREVVESDEDDNDSNSDVPLAWKQAASPVSVASAKQPQTVASEEGEGDVEIRETTPLVMVTEAEREASNMEVKGKEELEAVPAVAEEDKEEKRAEEVERTWSDTPLRQVGDDKLEWLGEDLGWPTPLMSAAPLADFDKRVAGVEQQFQRELEAAREELLAARAHYTIAKRTLATLAEYRRDCQAFLAWQEENNVGEGD